MGNDLCSGLRTRRMECCGSVRRAAGRMSAPTGRVVEDYRNALELTLDRLTRSRPGADWSRPPRRCSDCSSTSRDAAGVVRGVRRRHVPSRARLVQNPEDLPARRRGHRRLGHGSPTGACATARTAVADLSLDAVVTGHRTGPRTLRWVYCKFCETGPPLRTRRSCASRYWPAESETVSVLDLSRTRVYCC